MLRIRPGLVQVGVLGADPFGGGLIEDGPHERGHPGLGGLGHLGQRIPQGASPGTPPGNDGAEQAVAAPRTNTAANASTNLMIR